MKLQNKLTKLAFMFLAVLITFTMTGYVQTRSSYIVYTVNSQPEYTDVKLKPAKIDLAVAKPEAKSVSPKSIAMAKSYSYFDIPLDKEIQDLVYSTMNKFSITLEPQYIYSLIFHESGFNKLAESYVGCKGYMQLNPDTFYGAYDNMMNEFPELKGTMPRYIFNTKTNISVGLYYLRSISRYFDYNTVNYDNFGKILTCYNRGITGAKRYSKANGTYTSNYSRVIFQTAIEIKRNKGLSVG